MAEGHPDFDLILPLILLDILVFLALLIGWPQIGVHFHLTYELIAEGLIFSLGFYAYIVT